MSRRASGGIRNDRLRDLYRAAVKQGWRAEVDGRGHVQLINPRNGKRFAISATAEGGAMSHVFENTRASARRAGLDV